jgi:hypothetical protein
MLEDTENLLITWWPAVEALAQKLLEGQYITTATADALVAGYLSDDAKQQAQAHLAKARARWSRSRS